MTDVSANVLQPDVSRKTLDALEIYIALLKKWNPTINLVSTQSLADVWHRHVADSAQLMPWIDSTTARWGDMGAGGGLPGIVVAILARGAGMSIDMVLVESDSRKCAFLQTIRQVLSLEITIIAKRIEDCTPLACDVVSARALAPLVRLLPLAARHLNSKGKALFLKGKSFEEEIVEARRHWSFTVTRHPSVTDRASVILEIGQISNAD